MAFRLPDQRLSRPHNHEQQQQQQQPRQQPVHSPSSQASPLPLSPSAFSRPDETDSTEWVIFSPTQARSTASTAARRAGTVSTGRTPRLSDFGSLGSPHGQAEDEDDDEHNDEDLLAEEEDNTELDSLDDGLHAFREPSLEHAGPPGMPDPTGQLHQSDPAMLPAHDGLGTFPTSSMNVQEQLWQHERFNPQRRSEIRFRRPSSVERHLERIADAQPRDSDYDRWQRIEQWRMDQSKALLYEAEKETRQSRRTSRTGKASERPRAAPRMSTSEVMGDVSGVESASSNKKNHARVNDTPAESGENGSEESFWRRITRKVIKDLIGLDDSLLSVILGESLMPIAEEDGKTEELSQPTERHAKKRKASTILEPDLPEEMDEMLRTITTSHQGDTWWQERLLDRIARELGSLVHQIREDPGAFSTYKRSQSSLLQEDAGSSTPRPDHTSTFPSQTNNLPNTTSHTSTPNVSVHAPQFAPTLQDTNNNPGPHSESSGLEGEQGRATKQHELLSRGTGSESPMAERATDYWEREVDVGLVFHYLRKRLFADKIPYTRNSSQRRVDNPSQRAAIIRQHHPLVARAHEIARSQWSLQRNQQSYSNPTNSPAGAGTGSGVGNTASPILYRRVRRSSSSCASQSTRRSVSTKRTLASGSSRHYWDLGGSVGSGSGVGVMAAVGGAGGGMGMGDI